MKQAKDNIAGRDRVIDNMSETACRGKRIAEAGDRVRAGSLIADGAARDERRRTDVAVAFRHGFAHLL